MEPMISGVYFLLKEGKVKYVGESKDICRRIAEHTAGYRSHGKLKQDFDRWEFISIKDKKARLDIERTLIMMLQPEWNIADNTKNAIVGREYLTQDEKIKPLCDEEDMRCFNLDPFETLSYITTGELEKLTGISASYFNVLADQLRPMNLSSFAFGIKKISRKWIVDHKEVIYTLQRLKEKEVDFDEDK